MDSREKNELISEFDFRWLIRRDLPSVLSMLNIDGLDLRNLLRCRNVIGIVLTERSTDKNVGVAIYELQKNEINVVHFACDCQYTDVFFTVMVNRLTDKLSKQRRTRLHVNVPEHDISSQIRLSEFGFLGSQVNDLVVMSYHLHKEYDDNDDDHYYGHQ